MKISHRLIVALLFGLSCISTAFAADMQPITVENPYARAVPPTARNSGAFMVIRNNSDRDLKVVAAKSDVSEVTELHNHIHDNGVMRMRRVDSIDVPAHGSVALKPGSYHVMLINLKQPLKPQDPVHIDLTLDDGSTVPVDLQARQVGMGMPVMQKNSGAMKCGANKCGSGR